MAYCPNCNAPIVKDAQDCDVCGTSFGQETWLPLDALPQPAPRFSVASLLFKLGIVAVLLPLAGLVLGLLTTLLVPGCHCDEIFGCHGCGFNDITAFLLYDGYEFGLVAILVVFPAAVLLSGLLAFVKRRDA
jgi:hypothetical protein